MATSPSWPEITLAHCVDVLMMLVLAANATGTIPCFEHMIFEPTSCYNMTLCAKSETDGLGEEIEDGELIDDDDDIVEEKLGVSADGESSPRRGVDEMIQKQEKEENLQSTSNEETRHSDSASNDQSVDGASFSKTSEELVDIKNSKDVSKNCRKDYSENRRSGWKRKGARRSRNREDVERKQSKKFRRRRDSTSYDSPGVHGASGHYEGFRDDNQDDYETLFVRGASPVFFGESKDIQNQSSFPDYETAYGGDGRNRDYGACSKQDFPSAESNLKEGAGNKVPSLDEESRKEATEETSTSRRMDKSPLSRNEKHSRRARMRKGGKSKKKSPKDKNNMYVDICTFFMQGKCHKKNDCPYSHNFCPQRKMEVCRYYLMDACTKKNKCMYMHQDFPCKFFHTGLKCYSGDKCKFSHGHLSDAMRTALSKHLKSVPNTQPKPLLRLGHEGMGLLNYPTDVRKIPSLFDIQVPIPIGLTPGRMSMAYSPKNTSVMESEHDGQDGTSTPMPQSPTNDIRGFNQLWGSDDMDGFSISKYDNRFVNDMTEMPTLRNPVSRNNNVTNLVNETGNFKMNYFQEQNFHISSGEVDVSKSKSSTQNNAEKIDQSDNEAQTSPETNIPLHLPKKQLELFLRIQKQQREAKSCSDQAFDGKVDNSQEKGCSSDEEDNLSSIIMSIYKKDLKTTAQNEAFPTPSKSVSQPSIPIQMQDLKQIQKDESVIKLLSKIDLKNILHTATTSSSPCTPSQHPKSSTKKVAIRDPRIARNSAAVNSLPTALPIVEAREASQTKKQDSTVSSMNLPKYSPKIIKRDPRTVKDSIWIKSDKSGTNHPGTQSVSFSCKPSSNELLSREYKHSEIKNKYSGTLEKVDVKKCDSHHKAGLHNLFLIGSTSDFATGKKLEDNLSSIKCTPSTPFGDVDLRIPSNNSHATSDGQPPSSINNRDVDWRMFPFKPVPMHIPATEIDASLLSHPPIPYRVVLVAVPKPDYTSLKLNVSDPQVQRDPRLRKISESQYLKCT